MNFNISCTIAVKICVSSFSYFCASLQLKKNEKRLVLNLIIMQVANCAVLRPEFFYYLIYGNFFSDLGSGDKKRKK